MTKQQDNIKDRVLELAAYYAPNRAEFCRIVGWSQQYLSGMLGPRGSVGLTPVAAILKTFPEVNARWLILGEGQMVERTTIVERTMKQLEQTKKKLALLQSLEEFVPMMTPEQLRRFNQGNTDFSEEEIACWQSKISK